MLTPQQNEQLIYAEVCLEALNSTTSSKHSALLELAEELAIQYNLDTRKLIGQLFVHIHKIKAA